MLRGTFLHKEKGILTGEVSKRYDKSRYSFFLNAPFEISNRCCNVMKKAPAKEYAKKTGKKPIIAMLAEESNLRTQKWLKEGCNAFDNKNPTSNPLSFWTEQDILQYIRIYNVKICSVYGDIIPDYSNSDNIDGQIDIIELVILIKVKLAHKPRHQKAADMRLQRFVVDPRPF